MKTRDAWNKVYIEHGENVPWSAERLLEVKPIVKKIVNGQPVVVEE